MLRNALAQRQVSRHAADQHLAHGVIRPGVLVDVLHAAQGRIRALALVVGAHRLDAVVAQPRHLQLLRHQVQVEQGPDVGLRVRTGEVGGVEVAEQDVEGRGLLVAQAVAAVLGVLRVEVPAEDGRVVAEELLVHGVGEAVGADVDRDERVREESERDVSVASRGMGWREARGEAYSCTGRSASSILGSCESLGMSGLPTASVFRLESLAMAQVDARCALWCRRGQEFGVVARRTTVES